MSSSFPRKYGLNVYKDNPESVLNYAVSKGLNHIEINLSDEKLTLNTFTNERIKTLKTLAEKNNVQLSFHIPYYTNISDVLFHLRRASIKYLLKSIRIAGRLGATHITLHLGSFYWFPVEKWERKKALQRFVKSLNKVLKLCEEQGVVIALENVVPIPAGSEYYLLGDNIEDFKYIFSVYDSDYLKFCLDTGHAQMAEGVIAYINNFRDRLCSIHYHDNNGFNDAHLAIGNGKVPWQKLAAKLEEIEFNGPLISECRNIEAHKSAQIFEHYFLQNRVR